MAVLKALVIIMGVLIVAGIAVVGVTIYNRATESDEGGRAEFGTAILEIGPDCHVDESRIEDERLLVRTDGPAGSGCARIHVLDIETGAPLGVIEVVPGR